MKATLSLLTLMTFILGFGFVGSALAQEDAGPTSADEASVTPESQDAPEAPGADTANITSNDRAEKNKTQEEALEQGRGLYTSVKGGEWLMAFGFLGMLLGSIGRWATAKKWGFIKTKAGGYVIAGSVGLGILGGLIIEAGTFSVSMLSTAAVATLAAMALHAPAKAVKKKLVGVPKA